MTRRRICSRMCVSLMIISILIGISLGGCNTTPKEIAPRNVILLIGDGMGVAQVYAAMTVKKDSLHMEKFPYVGLIKTSSADNYVTDSGAGGTALATGHKTKNGAIAVDTAGNSLKSILQYAMDANLSGGLVSTSSITHATPASFLAHQISRASYQDIAADFLKTNIDVFIGGGLDDFSKRDDGRDLTVELAEKGYTVLTSMDAIVTHEKGKLAGFTAPGHNPKMLEGRGNMLPDATATAIRLLNQNPKGFFLMVEGSQIDWGGHANDTEYIVTETIDFDEAVGIALEFARKDKNTLVVVTADHETGGLGLNQGNIVDGTVIAAYTTEGHTGVMVPVFAYGPGAEQFTGVYENTGIFHKIKKLMGL
jgi:alkaline phosphatase